MDESYEEYLRHVQEITRTMSERARNEFLSKFGHVPKAMTRYDWERYKATQK
jgi:hypothetical protein